MKKIFVLAAAASLFLAASGSALAAPWATGPHDMFNSTGDGTLKRDICGSSSVASHASDKSGGNSKVGENGSPQWFDGDFGGTCPGATQGADGRCDNPDQNGNGRGHIADNNCPAD